MKFFTHFFIFVILLSPAILFAADTPTYNPLVGLPGFDDEILGAETNFNDYINALYAIAIAIAALLAVIKVIIAGVKWMLTDIVTSKEEAKKDIKGALLGLIIVLSAVLILTVINPNLVSVDLNKTVIGDEYVPPPPPPILTFTEKCSAAGGNVITCPWPHPGEDCQAPGIPAAVVCNPGLINNCAKGTTCLCESVPDASTLGTSWNCDIATYACEEGAEGTVTPVGTTRVRCD